MTLMAVIVGMLVGGAVHVAAWEVRHSTSICIVVGVASMTLIAVVVGMLAGGAVRVAAWKVRHGANVCRWQVGEEVQVRSAALTCAVAVEGISCLGEGRMQAGALMVRGVVGEAVEVGDLEGCMFAVACSSSRFVCMGTH